MRWLTRFVQWRCRHPFLWEFGSGLCRCVDCGKVMPVPVKKEKT
jgi:hypothetical protein